MELGPAARGKSRMRVMLTIGYRLRLLTLKDPISPARMLKALRFLRLYVLQSYKALISNSNSNANSSCKDRDSSLTANNLQSLECSPESLEFYLTHKLLLYLVKIHETRKSNELLPCQLIRRTMTGAYQSQTLQ
jgi:hypothetical protein